MEEKAEYKSEYYKGVVYAMAGGTLDHSSIAVNCVAELRAATRGRCRVFNSDLRLNVADARYYTYPDVAVVCGEPRRSPKDRNSITNPVLVVEVLSPSTEHIDRGRKFREYRKIPTLREYVMVSQDEPMVERLVRSETGDWVVRDPVAGLDADVVLESVDCRIAMSEIYLGIEFPAITSPAGETSVQP